MGKLYYTIGEVAEQLGEATSTLRFWEKEFDVLQPVKNKRGVRSYTERDIDLLRRIKYLTRDCGYTLDGVREQLRIRPIEDPHQQLVNQLADVRQFLVQLREVL